MPPKRKYPTAEDIDPDTSGDQSGTDAGVSVGTNIAAGGPGDRINPTDTNIPITEHFHFKRLFNQYITNAPKVVGLEKATSQKEGKILWNWTRIPVDDLRFYLTPRTTDLLIASGHEFKINKVAVTLKQFTVFTDAIHTTSTGEQFTQLPTPNPFVFIYEDTSYILPRRDVDEMAEWEIKSNLTHQANRSDCTLKRFVSKIPKGMEIDIEDLELFNTTNWTIRTLDSPINVTRNVDMPWVSIAENLRYENAVDGVNNETHYAHRFPHINTITSSKKYGNSISDPDKKENIRTFKEPDKLKPWESGGIKQQLLVSGKPFGSPLAEFLIKPVPYTDIVNQPIPYCIEFYAVYEIDCSVRASPMLYKHPRSYVAVSGMQHWAGKRLHGLGNVITKQDATVPNI